MQVQGHPLILEESEVTCACSHQRSRDRVRQTLSQASPQVTLQPTPSTRDDRMTSGSVKRAPPGPRKFGFGQAEEAKERTRNKRADAEPEARGKARAQQLYPTAYVRVAQLRVRHQAASTKQLTAAVLYRTSTARRLRRVPTCLGGYCAALSTAPQTSRQRSASGRHASTGGEGTRGCRGLHAPASQSTTRESRLTIEDATELHLDMLARCAPPAGAPLRAGAQERAGAAPLAATGAAGRGARPCRGSSARPDEGDPLDCAILWR